MKKIIGISLIVIGICIMVFVFYRNSHFSQTTRTFAPYSILTSSWEKYKLEFLNSDGRILDHSQNDITTSEGQSYAMLRAVWIDDRPTFDKVWTWTKQNLKRPNDHLLGWRWGKLNGNSYGLMPNGGDNSAADADSDIALALIFAGKRWDNPQYTTDAQALLTDMWSKEVDSAKGNNYLVAGNWAKGQDVLVINPSYFAPYAWRIFATIDTKDNWNSLITPAYDLLSNSGDAPLDKSKGVGLPPDWVGITRSDGSLRAINTNNLTTNYSYDAMRVPFRIALDYQWFGEKRAYDYLQNSFKILLQTYQSSQSLPSSFSHDGTITNQSESPAMYATSLGYFITTNPDVAQAIYQDKITRLYANANDSFDPNLPYYDQNWLWFGTAFYNKLLVNLAQ